MGTYKTAKHTKRRVIFECVVLIHLVGFCKTNLACRQELDLIYSLHYFLVTRLLIPAKRTFQESLRFVCAIIDVRSSFTVGGMAEKNYDTGWAG